MYTYIYMYWLAPPPQGPTNPECFSPRQGDVTIRFSLLWSAYLYMYIVPPPPKKKVLLILLTLLALKWRHLLQDRFGLSSWMYSFFLLVSIEVFS